MKHLDLFRSDGIQRVEMDKIQQVRHLEFLNPLPGIHPLSSDSMAKTKGRLKVSVKLPVSHKSGTWSDPNREATIFLASSR